MASGAVGAAGQGINLVTNVAAQAADHNLSFFSTLRAELGFYVGCLKPGAAAAEGERTSFPVPDAPEEPTLSARGLYDAYLTLRVDHRVVATTWTRTTGDW
jgi:hypothetical protein